MYSRQEKSVLRQEFWKVFGQYMSPIPSSEGEKVNWVNYKTGEKNIFIRTKAEAKMTEVALVVTHTDHVIQQLYFEHLEKLRSIFEETAGEDWNWLLHVDEEGKTVSKISITLDGPDIMRREEWPAVISFLKSRLIVLDEFWNQVKHTLEQLR